MIINYNSLSRGRDAWLKNDVGEVNGSPPTSSGIACLKRFFAVFLLLLTFISQDINAQVSYSQDWTATGLASWTSPSSVFGRTTSQICGTGGSIRGERYYGNSGSFVSPSLGTSNGGMVTFSYGYKVVNWSAATVATPAASVGTITLEYGSSATGPWTVAQTINSTNHVAANTCATKTATFTPPSGALFVRFNVVSNVSVDVYYYFDDIVVSQGAPPTCLVPTGLTASAFSSSTLTGTMAWTAPTVAPTNYQYAVTTSSTPPTSGTVASGTSVTGVTYTPNATNYLHVRSFCGGSDYSTWNSISFFGGYCTPAPTSVDGTGITRVAYGSVDNPSGAETGNYGNYSNLSSSHGQGTTAVVNITYTTGYTYGTKIWVDWNGDFDFDDAGENVYTGESLSASPTTLAASFVIPVSTPLGSYRMRIAGADSATLIPCYVGTYATYEDYSITVTLPPSCLEVPTLTSSAVAGTTANINWTAPTAAPAGGYDYELRTSGAVGSGATGLVYSGNEAGLTYAFTGLTGLTSYTAYVRSHCGTGDTSTWRSVAFTTVATCFPVATLTSSAVAANTANINWTAPTAVPANGYNYELRTSGAAGSGATGLVYSGNETALTRAFTGLTSLTAYTAYVRSSCAVGDESTWRSVAFTTLASCFPVATLTSASIGSTNATINWTAPTTAPAAGYEYEVRTSGAAGSGSTGLTTNGTVAAGVLTKAITSLASNTAYTAYVRSNCGAGDFSTWRSVTFTTLLVNDDCLGAITLASCSGGTQSINGTTVGSALDTNYTDCGATGSNTTERGVWYKYVGDNNQITITTCNATGYDTRLTVYSGSCGTLSCVGGNDDMSVALCPASGVRSEVAFNAIAGTDYYVFVHGYQTGTSLSTTGAFVLSWTCAPLCTPATANDECTTAQAFVVGTPLSTNNSCASASLGVAYPSCGASQFATYSDSWYSFNSGTNTSLEFSAVASLPTAVGFAVYSGVCGTLTQVGCNASGAATIVTLTANTNYLIRVFSTSSASRGSFVLNAKVPCLNATAVTLASSTATSATFTWTAPASAPSNGYEWEIRSSGAAGSGATGLVASGNAAGLTATSSLLTASTSYTFYIRSSCSPGDFSVWSTGRAFVTPCASVDVPYVQDFSGATIPGMPACTSALNAGSGSPWITTNDAFEGPVFPASQGNYLIYEYDAVDVGNAWFFTQGVNLTANTAYAISYKYGNDGGELFPEKMKVAYGTTASVAGMTTVLADHPNIIAGNLNNQVIFTPTTSGVYFFGFNGYSDPDMDILQLDDIKVDLAPNCIRPSAVTSVSSVNGATFSWTPPATAPAIGYEWAVNTSDVPPASGATVTSATASATGLDADTFYYFHVRSKCSATETSDWVTYSFITGYCMSTTTVPQNYYISSFSTTGGALNVTNTSTYSASGYSNFSSQTIGNYPGATTSFSLTPTNAATGTINSYGVSIFIDWNNDLDFDDANERVYSAPFSTSTNPRVGTFTVPAGTAYGNYRMRVRADFINSTTNVNACGRVQIGETEDYTFNVSPAPPVIASFTPAIGCSNDLATTVVSITGTNLTGVTEVKLDDVVTPHTVVSDTNITVTLNASSRPGFFNLYKSGDGSSAVSTAPFEVTESPEVAPITGPSSVCLPASNTIALASETLTGAWSSSDIDVATVSSGGVVTPVAAGTVMINYTVTDSGCSTVVSYEVTVNNPIEITASTATQTVVTGGNTSFSVTATGSGAPSESGLTYQWESTVDGETFVTLTNDAIYGGTNTSTLTLTSVPEELNFTLYNVIITGACTSVTSDLAVLFVGDTGIETQPDPATICDGGAGTASFTVVASSDVTTYEWQEDRGGDNWQILTDVGIYSGTSTPTLTLTGLTTANTGWRYKVVVTGIGSAESNPVSLTVSQGAAVTSGPANQTVCYTGGTTNFTVAATNASSYQWQYSADGSVWDNVVNSTPTGATYSGTTSATLNVSTTSATPSTGMHLYRAIVNSAAPCTAVTTATAQLSVNVPAVTLQPSPVTINAGNTATFTVNATGMTTPTYQWQYATAVGGTYTNVTNASPTGVTYTGGSTNALSVVIANSATAGSAHYYKVIVTSGTGCTTESNPAQLTIRNYCTPTTPLNTTAYFTAFNTTGGQTNISNTSTYSAGGYGNFTNLSASQLQGQTVNFSTTTTGGTAGVAIWVDWNQDATFDASERVFNTTAYSTSPTGSFTVPATALAGTTRMRILMDWNTSNPSNPCLIATTTPRGEVEDYNFTVMVPPPCTTPVAGTVSATKTNVCVSGSTVLTVTGYTVGQTGITFQWHNSAGPIAGQTGFTYTTPVLTAPESYFFRATCANGNATADSNVINVTVSNPLVSNPIPASRCGTGTVTLAATPSAGTSINWYAASTGGVPLGTGDTFTTPSISANTTYYAAAEAVSSGTATVGTGTSLTGAIDAVTAFNNRFSQYRAQYLFTAAELRSFGVVAGPVSSIAFDITTIGDGASNANFRVAVGTTTSTVLTTTFATNLSTVYGPSTYVHAVGRNTINFATAFNWDGTSNIIVEVSHSGANLTNNAVTVYTNATSSVLYSISASPTTGTVVNTRPNITFAGSVACSSARTAIAATVSTAPALTVSRATTTICAGSVSETLTVTQGASDYDTYTWLPATGVSGTALTGFTFNPSTTTTYTLKASQSAGANCAQEITHVVNVNALPPAPVITPASAAVCEGSVQELTIQNSAATATFGTGTSSQGTTSYPNPLSAYYGGAKHQILYTVAELNAQGMQAGAIINRVSLNISAFTASACTNFTIRMGTTAQTALTGFVTGTSTVYGPTTFTPSATGVVNFVLTAPYVWNGTSNLVVEMVHNAGNGGNGSGTTVRYTSTPTNTVYYGASDSVANGITGFDALTSYTSSGASSLRPNTIFGYSSGAAPTWSPLTGLYTDAAGTIAYTGDSRYTVYAKPTGPVSYTATAASCGVTSAPANLTVAIPTTWYVDADNDNYGNSALPTVLACVKPAFYAAVGGDCNDANAAVSPGVAEIFYNGIDDNCDGNIDEGRQVTTALLANRCGTTLTKIYQSVNCEFRITGVTGYRFRIKNLDNPSEPEQITERLNAHFTFNSLASYHYATNYSVEVMVQRNNVWLNYYGPVCTVRTPDLPKLAVCGGTVAAVGTAIFTEVLTSVTAYRFEVTNVATQQVTPINNTRPYFRFSEIPGYTTGGLYSVKVSVKTTGDWSPYGAACVITAPGGTGPEIPTDKIIDATSNVFKVVPYPNPFAQSFGLNITTESTAVVNVKVYDMLGKLIETRNESVSDLKEQRIGERYAAGVYNIIVTQEENVKTIRVIKR